MASAKRQTEKRKPPSFFVFGVTQSWIEPWPPALRRSGTMEVGTADGEKASSSLYFQREKDWGGQSAVLIKDATRKFTITRRQVNNSFFKDVVKLTCLILL